jgi:acetamidase/formamidase
MAVYRIEPQEKTVHKHFSRDLPPILDIESGDIVQYRTLNARWGLVEQNDSFEEPQRFDYKGDSQLEGGLALCGPVFIRDARPGMTLELRIKTIRPAAWAESAAGGFSHPVNEALGLADGPPCVLRWALDADLGIATNQFGQALAMSPFMGTMGMPPDQPGIHPASAPRFCGGNLDCKELVAGSSLFLPIAVKGGLFSVGDGHALQGNGEVAGAALECPMERVEIEFHLHQGRPLVMPRACTPAGWLTFGLHEDLNEAWLLALENMLDLMQDLFSLERKHALALASAVVDLNITQVVNGTCGVHAFLPHEMIGVAPGGKVGIKR